MSDALKEMALMIAGLDEAERTKFLLDVTSYLNVDKRRAQHDMLTHSVNEADANVLKEKLILYCNAMDILPTTVIAGVELAVETITDRRGDMYDDIELAVLIRRTDTPKWIHRQTAIHMRLSSVAVWSMATIADRLRSIKDDEFANFVPFLHDYFEKKGDVSELELQLFIKQVYDTGIEYCDFVRDKVKARGFPHAHSAYWNRILAAITEYIEAIESQKNVETI